MLTTTFTTLFPRPGSSGRPLPSSPEQYLADGQLPEGTGPYKMWVQFRMTRVLSFASRWLGARCGGVEVGVSSSVVSPETHTHRARQIHLGRVTAF